MEQQKTKQHTQTPDPTETDNLLVSDRLVYANLRRFMNKDTYEAFPSMATVARLSNYSEDKVRKSIKKLVANGDLEILPKKEGRNNVYKFNKLTKNFERFTKEFLDHPELSSDEKAYIIGFQSQAFKDEQHSMSTLTNIEIAQALHMSEKSVIKYNRSLIKKGIMEEISTQAKDGFGFRKIARTIDNARICQAILFIKEDVDRHDEEIKDLQKKVEMLINENRELKKELYKQNYTTEVEYTM